MSQEQNITATFRISTKQSIKPEDLMLPSMVEVVKYLARMAAERDYRAFLDSLNSQQNNNDAPEDGHA